MQNCSRIYNPLVVDVIVYKPSPYGLGLYMINPSGYALGFIIYHIEQTRVYVSFIFKTIVQKCCIIIRPCLNGLIGITQQSANTNDNFLVIFNHIILKK